ncbi:MAG: hypothetical protein B6I20_05345 [Bacteroidetes bacterium 4572_117]|nr:MAG: hypothetical protein B6I20_05345 [Bacteroidetes bacterium 4572_117]
MEESLWYKKLEKVIQEENEKLYKNDSKFYQVDSFLKVSKKIDQFSPHCKKCSESKIVSEELAENLFDYLKGDFNSRRGFEKKLDSINKHLRKEHKMYPKQYFISLFSLLGVIGGLLAGLIISYLTLGGFMKQSLLFGFVGGLIVGRIWGKVKDNKLLKAGRTL